MTGHTVRGSTLDERGAVAWRVSTRSVNGGGNCVEAGPVNDTSNRVAVRHSHHPDSATFLYTSTAWRAFLTGIKNGHFDFTRLNATASGGTSVLAHRW